MLSDAGAKWKGREVALLLPVFPSLLWVAKEKSPEVLPLFRGEAAEGGHLPDE